MAVYRRSYQPYEGPLTPTERRWLVLPRYAFREVFSSRLLVLFLVAAAVPVLVEGFTIWLFHNPTARALLHVDELNLGSIGAEFFYRALAVQGWLAFALTAWIGPSLVAPDLTDGALALYLSRPLSRSQYVLGKASVILALGAGITLLPGLVLFVLQASLEGWGWALANVRIAAAIVVSSLLWCALLALLAVAVSAWVRWRVVASGLFLVVFFAGAGFGEIWNLVLDTRWGRILNIDYLVDLIWRALFGLPLERALPLAAAAAALVALGLACTFLLDRRLRAKEVVR
jgi:ABC-2 type transport system permease protein